MLPKQSSHLHAALLFIDFDLTREAGELYTTNGYGSPRKDIPRGVTFKKYSGAQSTKEIRDNNKLFNRLFLKK